MSLPAPAVRLVVPATVTSPFVAVCVMAPAVTSVRLPLTFRPLVVVGPAPAVATEVTEPIITAFASV